MSCIGILISAAITSSAINQVEDFYRECGLEHDDTDYDNYRGAAGWMMSVGSAAIIFNIAMTILRILYLKSVVNVFFKSYALIVSA